MACEGAKDNNDYVQNPAHQVSKEPRIETSFVAELDNSVLCSVDGAAQRRLNNSVTVSEG